MAVNHFGDDDEFAKAFTVPAQRVGDLQGLFGVSILEARAQDARAAETIFSTLDAAAKVIQATSGPEPITGVAVENALDWARDLISTNVPHLDAIEVRSRIDNLIVAAVNNAMASEDRVEFLAPPAEPVPYFVDGNIVVPDSTAPSYNEYRVWLAEQSTFHTRVTAVRDNVLSAWQTAFIDRIT